MQTERNTSNQLQEIWGLSPPALTLSGELRRAPMCDDCQSQSESARADAVMSLSDFFYPQLDLRSDETAS